MCDKKFCSFGEEILGLIAKSNGPGVFAMTLDTQWDIEAHGRPGYQGSSEMCSCGELVTSHMYKILQMPFNEIEIFFEKGKLIVNGTEAEKESFIAEFQHLWCGS